MALINIGRRRPATLGVRAGRLAPCPPDNSACVCSQYELNQAGGGGPHHIPPLRFAGDPALAMRRLAGVIAHRADAKLIEQRQDYLYAEFARISWLGLIDDTEFLLEPDADGSGGTIHVRSSSRRTVSDLGINRARVEELREAFDEAR